MEWSWTLWKAVHERQENTSPTSPNFARDYIEAPASVLALLDQDGNILWDDEYEAAEDLVACPSCLSEELTESELLHGDKGCTHCGCVFSSDTGDIILYDPSIAEELTIFLQCTTCMAQVKITDFGECPDCGTILDAVLAERRIKEQRNG